MRLRFRGDVGGGVRLLVLPTRDFTIGSASSNDVVLPVSGVSRRHALFRWRDDTLEVSDLQSRNGVHVNGARVESSPLAAGDEVQFGPVVLRLEAVDDDDVELGLALGADDPVDSAPIEAQHRTSAWTGPPSERDWLPVVERVIAALRSGEGGLARALAVLVEEGGLQGCCAAEIRNGVPVVLASAGILAEISDDTVVEALAGRKDNTEVASVSFPGAPRAVCAALPGDPVRLLMAWDAGGGGGVEAVLRVVVRLVGWSDVAPEGASDGGLREAQTLVFPRRHVRGSSPVMLELYERMAPVADTDLPILIVGETGVGKEDFARALHLSSSRAQGPFVAVNCAAIPSELLEAELFGVGKGAASGVLPRPGKFQLAHEGTLFLDEIGDMSGPLQAKLLRVLETGEVEPVGAPTVRVDLRIVSATHVDLASRVETGQFRADLYYRLCGALLRVPPLRERRGDIPALIDGILRPLAARAGKPIRGITAKALRALVDHDWPGNVRELEHEVQRLFHGCASGEAIEYGMLREDIRQQRQLAPDTASLDLQRHVDAVEERLIREALARTGGNRTEAAKLLGVSRNGLALKVSRLGLAL